MMTLKRVSVACIYRIDLRSGYQEDCMSGISLLEVLNILIIVLIYAGIPLILFYVIMQIRQIARSVKRIEEQLQETQARQE